MVQRGRQGAQAIEFLAGLDEHILCDVETPQTPVRAPHALDGWLVALRHDDEQVQNAAFLRHAPRARTEEPDALGMLFADKPFSNLIQEILADCLHAAERTGNQVPMERAQRNEKWPRLERSETRQPTSSPSSPRKSDRPS